MIAPVFSLITTFSEPVRKLHKTQQPIRFQGFKVASQIEKTERHFGQATEIVKRPEMAILFILRDAMSFIQSVPRFVNTLIKIILPRCILNIFPRLIIQTEPQGISKISS